MSLKEIQEWLCHSDVSTTSNIYTHLDHSGKINVILPAYPSEQPIELYKDKDKE